MGLGPRPNDILRTGVAWVVTWDTGALTWELALAVTWPLALNEENGSA